MSTNMLESLEKMVQYVGQALTEIGNEVHPLMLGTQTEKMDVNIKFLFLLKELKEKGEELAKFYNVCENELAGRINKLIDAAGLEEVVITHNGVKIKISPETKFFISCKADKKPEMIAWMKAHSIGRELVKEDVHPKSLEKFVKEELIGKGTLPPAGLISIHQTETITTRKLPNK